MRHSKPFPCLIPYGCGAWDPSTVLQTLPSPGLYLSLDDPTFQGLGLESFSFGNPQPRSSRWDPSHAVNELSFGNVAHVPTKEGLMGTDELPYPGWNGWGALGSAGAPQEQHPGRDQALMGPVAVPG